MTKSTSYSIGDKILWIVGSLERLATLGLLDSNVPMKVSQNAIDRYLKLDENREDLFEDYYEFSAYLIEIIKQESDPIPSDDEIVGISELLYRYKNDREETVRFALSHNFT